MVTFGLPDFDVEVPGSEEDVFDGGVGGWWGSNVIQISLE